MSSARAPVRRERPPLARAGWRLGLALALSLGAGLAQAAADATEPKQPPAASARPDPANVDALARALASQPVVLLGEVHDNAAQHALRLAALRQWIAGGARPALAFEQLDADRQAALDRVRAAFGPELDRDARVARLVETAGAKGWQWEYYRPYLALALEYELPVVAANLSRARAMRVATEGVEAVFDAPRRLALGLDAIDPTLQHAQEHEIEEGHCGRAPADALAPMAQAQIARDAVLAASIEPYAQRGVVLLTGNGHVRRDIGVPRHLPADLLARMVAIGLLEDDAKPLAPPGAFDLVLRTAAQPRPDPCLSVGHMPAR